MCSKSSVSSFWRESGLALIRCGTVRRSMMPWSPGWEDVDGIMYIILDKALSEAVAAHAGEDKGGECEER